MQKLIEREVRKSMNSLFKTRQIARWKLDSGFERWLGYRADNSLFWKKLYVLYYKLFDRKYYQGGLPMLNQAIRDFMGDVSGNQKQDLQRDMVYSLHRFGAMFTEYFQFEFPKLNTFGREQFITSKMRYVYCDILNKQENIPIFDQKDKTYQMFKNYYKRDVISISGATDFDKFQEFLNQNNSFIKKPVHGSSGRGIEILRVHDFDNDQQLFDYLLSFQPCMIEQIVTNCPEIKRIYPKALSTIRFPTIRTKQGVEIFAGYIRFGQKGTIVDNTGSGGIIAVVDMESGIIETPAYDGKGNKYLSHPDTNEMIIGFNIPQWDEALKLAKILSTIVPSNRYIGWDLALTDNGWIMIEGNVRGEFYGQQFPDRIGKRARLEMLILS